MSGIYARIEIPETSIKKLQTLGLDVDRYDDGSDDAGNGWRSIPMERGDRFLSELEKLGYPVPVQGFIEDESGHTSYNFVCPGDGTYAEVQCSEFGTPVVPVFWNGEIMKMVPEDTLPAVTYFQALDKFNEEVNKR